MFHGGARPTFITLFAQQSKTRKLLLSFDISVALPDLTVHVREGRGTPPASQWNVTVEP